MILIADCGSTKGNWCLLNNGVVKKQISTAGINPFYQTEKEIILLLDTQLVSQIDDISAIQQIYFYGAGCAFDDKKRMIKDALSYFFLNALVVEIETDLLAAARSLFQHEQGVACILGTGSNSCFYDGHQIVENVPALGFVLGDEGSGAVLGKTLLSDALKNQLPEDMKEKLFDAYQLTPAIVLDNVYKKPFPNRYLAQFTPFLLQNIVEPSIFNIVFDCFAAFFARNVLQYPIEAVTNIGFVGSIAYHFRDVLEIVASEYRLEISSIVQQPMDGLIRFHQES